MLFHVFTNEYWKKLLVQNFFFHVPGSQKSNMAAAKPEVRISQLLDEIETTFQRLTPHFRGPAFQRTNRECSGI